MKLPTKQNKTFTSNSANTKDCFFSQGKTNQRNLIVSNYSYLEMAVIRELTANARDAHMSVKQTKPIELTIINKAKNAGRGFSFSIRDYGPGVTKDYLDNGWCEIGLSTKGQSNDQVGAFGIGRMTPFCVADSFTLTSYQNGKAYIYVMSENNQGVFQNTFMAERNTEEPDGLLVEFNSTTGCVAEQHFKNIRYIDMPMKILLDNKPIKTFSHADHLWNGPGWSLNGKGQQTIIYGGIAYDSPFYNGWGRSRSNPINIDVPLGELEVASSRENLMNTPKNKTVIEKHVNAAWKQLTSGIQKKIDACKTRKQAFQMYDDLHNSVPSLGVIKYKKEVLKQTTVHDYDSYNNYKGDQCHKGYPGKNRRDVGIGALYMDTSKYTARNYIKANNMHGRVIVCPSDKMSIEDFAHDLCLDLTDIKKASDLVDKTKKWLADKRKASKNTTPAQQKIQYAKYFDYHGKLHRGWIKSKLTPVATPLTYLVQMDQYHLVDWKILSTAENIDAKAIPKFTVVRKSVYKKLMATGKHKDLKDFAVEFVQKNTADIGYHIKRHDFYQANKDVLRFLAGTCEWRKLERIIARLKKSQKFCLNKKNYTKVSWARANGDYDTSPDMGIAGMIYSAKGLSDKTIEDLKQLYKCKYNEVK